MTRDSKGRFVKGQPSERKGMKNSEKSIKKQKKSLKQWYKNHPEEKKKLQEKQRLGRLKKYEQMKKDGTYDLHMKQRGDKISKAKKGKPLTEKHKKALIRSHWSKKPVREEVIKKTTPPAGTLPWNTGLTKESDERVFNHPSSQSHSEEWNKNVSQSLRESEMRKEYYESESFKKGCVKGAIEARKKAQIKPNGAEGKFLELIEKHNLPYEYTGDGSFWVDKRNPDFLNTKEEKTVVEINGVYWHFERRKKESPSLTREQVELEEKSHYERYGFKCIILWEDELENEDKILKKLGVKT